MTAMPPYERRFNRISLLPISLYCPQAARLSEAHGAGRAAFMSRAFHALLAGAPEARDLMNLLDESEREEVASWHRPVTLVLDDDMGLDADMGVVLDYDSAEKEVPVALNEFGWFVGPHDPDFVTKGTLDFAWVRTVRGVKIAYVADMKKSVRTTLDGPASLQLIAYALAYSAKVGAQAFSTAVWVLEDGTWEWLDEVVMLDSPRATKLLETVLAAARNTEGEPVTGPHCRSCWGRAHCGEHLLPAALAGTELAALTEPGGINAENALGLLLKYQAMKDLLGPVESALKAYAEQTGGIRDGNGKTWKPTFRRGRESVSVKDVRSQFGPDGEKVIKRGPGYWAFQWVKE